MNSKAIHMLSRLKYATVRLGGLASIVINCSSLNLSCYRQFRGSWALLTIACYLDQNAGVMGGRASYWRPECPNPPLPRSVAVIRPPPQTRLYHGYDHQLRRSPISMVKLSCPISAGDHQLTLVIRIDQTDQIAFDAVFMA